MVADIKAKMYFGGWKKKSQIGIYVAATIAVIAFFSANFGMLGRGFMSEFVVITITCQNGEHIWGGLALIVLWILWGVKEEFPTDKQIDDSFAELAKQRIQQSLDNLGIKQEDTIREPLTIIGVGSYTHSIEGEDKLHRFNPMVVEIIHFGKDKLLTNTIALDLLHQNDYVGKTNEFFYKDISAVSIEDDNSGNVASKRFLIKVHGQVELNTEIQQEQQSNAEYVAREIRKMLRENAGVSGEYGVESNKDSK